MQIRFVADLWCARMFAYAYAALNDIRKVVESFFRVGMTSLAYHTKRMFLDFLQNELKAPLSLLTISPALVNNLIIFSTGPFQ